MLENNIFDQWLRDEAERVLAKLNTGETLTQDDKLVIVLTGQMNHFHHLDVDLRQEIAALRIDMNQLRADMDRRFEAIYQAINNQTWRMIGAVGLIVILGKLIDHL